MRDIDGRVGPEAMPFVQDPDRLIARSPEEIAELADSGAAVVPYSDPSLEDKNNLLWLVRLLRLARDPNHCLPDSRWRCGTDRCT